MYPNTRNCSVFLRDNGLVNTIYSPHQDRCHCGDLISDPGELCSVCREDDKAGRIDLARWRYLRPNEIPAPGDEMRPSATSRWWLPVDEEDCRGPLRPDQLRTYRRSVRSASRGWRYIDAGELLESFDQLRGASRWQSAEHCNGRVADSDKRYRRRLPLRLSIGRRAA